MTKSISESLAKVLLGLLVITTLPRCDQVSLPTLDNLDLINPDTLGLDPDPDDTQNDESETVDQDPEDNQNQDDSDTADNSDTTDTDSDNTEPDSTEPDSTEPDSTEPDSTEPDSTEPDSDPADTDLPNDDPDDNDPENNDNESEFPDNEFCNAIADWEINWAQLEEEVVTLVNLERSQGAICGTESFAAAGPLTMNPALQCAARNHSMDMAIDGYFSHTSPDGVSPSDRINASEYDWMTWGENIALGHFTPEQVIDGWMNSPGHCSNIMNPNFTEIGVGFYEGNYWTQAFGSPR